MVKLCHEYKCVIIFLSPLIALPFKIDMKIPRQLLTFAVSLCSSSLNVSHQRFPLKTYAKVHINLKNKHFFPPLCRHISISLSSPLKKTTEELSPHKGFRVWWSGANEIRFYVSQSRRAEAFTLRPT